MMTRTRDHIRPRWSKVLSDLRGHKSRAILVILSIAVGVFAMGAIINASMILMDDVDASYASVNPANITIVTESFDEDFLGAIRRIPGVAEAEGRRHFDASVGSDGQHLEKLDLITIPDRGESTISVLEAKEGSSIPGENELLIGFDAMSTPRYTLGDLLAIELDNGTVRHVPVVGIVVDQTAESSPQGEHRGYIAYDSLEWMGEPADYDRLLVTVSGNPNDEAYIASIASQVEAQIEKSGRQHFRTTINKTNEHPQSLMVYAFLGVFLIVGLLIMLLSGSLIFNTLNALLAQDLRQIGVMKLVGARSGQVLGMYIVLILIFGLAALAIAVPAGAAAGYGLSWFLAYLLNAHVQGFRVFPAALVIQSVLAIAVPLAAGFIPVNKGSRIKVLRAISSDRSGQQASISRFWLVVMAKLQWLSRPIVLSMRNTFRHKGRLMLTLFTLTISGALFMAVFNDKLSMRAYMDQVGQHFGADISLNLTRPYRIESVTQTIRDVPGIQAVEAWSGIRAEVLDMQGNVLKDLQITAPPADGALLAPQMSVGRWLMPGDDKVIVISEAIQETIPGLEPGDTLRLSLAGGREEEWLLVGLFSFPNFADDLLAYSPYESIAGIQSTVNHTAAFRLDTSAQSAKGQEEIASALEEHLRAKGIDVASIETGATMRETSTKMIGIFITLLMIMAVLTAIVGSIGLTGTMGMNVLERTREIGIARAIGATDKEIRKSVVIESALIGLISWALAVPVSFPISYAILQIISTSMKIGVISLIVTPQGMIIWLGVVLVLTVLASILPARNASRLTIREVLAYE